MHVEYTGDSISLTTKSLDGLSPADRSIGEINNQIIVCSDAARTLPADPKQATLKNLKASFEESETYPGMP